MDVNTLTPAQRDALAQLQALTNGGDTEVSIGVLASVDWDVQVCRHSLCIQRRCVGSVRLQSSRMLSLFIDECELIVIGSVLQRLYSTACRLLFHHLRLHRKLSPA